MQVYEIYRTDEFVCWFDSQSFKRQNQIAKRIDKIVDYGHFGHRKDLDNGLWELKFNDGTRIYYIHHGDKIIFLLHGGNKNGQDSDIKKTRNIANKIRSFL